MQTVQTLLGYRYARCKYHHVAADAVTQLLLLLLQLLLLYVLTPSKLTPCLTAVGRRLPKIDCRPLCIRCARTICRLSSY